MIKQVDGVNQISHSPGNNGDENVRNLLPGQKYTVQAVHRKHSPKSSPSRRSPIGGRKIPGAFSNPARPPGIVKGTLTTTQHLSPIKKLAAPVKPVIIPRAVIKGTLQEFEMRSACFGELQALSDARAKEKKREDLEKQDAKEQEKNIYVGHTSIEDVTFVAADENDPFNSSPMSEYTEVNYSVPQEVFLSPLELKSSQRTSKAIGSDDVGHSSTTRRRRKRIFNRSLDFKSTLPTNPVALKTLTNTNTAKNQQYHSELKLEIIRKPGIRPASPTTKLRTVSEKQREEQGKQRAERAKRRRGEDMNGDPDDFNLNINDLSSNGLKHPRAPGDDEDYVTPQRPNEANKRVKWDVGLTTEKYLDEIVLCLQGRHRDMDQSSRKSCLLKKKVRDFVSLYYHVLFDLLNTLAFHR